jgi:hypothetical protein
VTIPKQTSTVDLAPALRPSVPAADDPTAASSVLNSVLDLTELSAQLREIANRYVDDGPRSAAHVLDLSGTLARAVLDWIARRPK